MTEKNMLLWNKVSKTNPKNTKTVKFGRSFTAIDPHSQVMEATRMFGPAGSGWGWYIKQVEYLPTNEVAILITLWHGNKEQAGLYIDKADTRKDGDCMKKATTDGLTKCLSYLGFNADIFLGLYDDNKYVAAMTAEFNQKDDPKHAGMKAKADAIIKKLEAADSLKELNIVRDASRNDVKDIMLFSKSIAREISTASQRAMSQFPDNGE